MRRRELTGLIDILLIAVAGVLILAYLSCPGEEPISASPDTPRIDNRDEKAPDGSIDASDAQGGTIPTPPPADASMDELGALPDASTQETLGDVADDPHEPVPCECPEPPEDLPTHGTFQSHLFTSYSQQDGDLFINERFVTLTLDEQLRFTLVEDRRGSTPCHILTTTEGRASYLGQGVYGYDASTEVARRGPTSDESCEVEDFGPDVLRTGHRTFHLRELQDGTYLFALRGTYAIRQD